MTLSDERAWDGLMALADELEPALAAAFLEVADRLRASYTLAALESAVREGRVDVLVDSVVTNPQAFAPLRVAIAGAVARVAQHELDRLPRGVRARAIQPATSPAAAPGGPVVPRTPTGSGTGLPPAPRPPASSVSVVFDGYNPRAVALVQEHGGRLIRQVGDEVRQAVRDVVTHGIKEGTGIAPMARDIKQFIGLTPNQQRAVRNYRAALEALDGTALDRALRDHRFDPTVERAIRTGTRLPAAQVDKLVEAYHRRTLAFRAETIARTEAVTALNTGQKAAWAQVVSDGGVLEGDVRRFWHVARDERTCTTCAPIPRMNRDGVGLDEHFRTPDGPVDGPTMHPRCRCTVFIRPFFR